MAVNPFKPTAGKMPPILIGRDALLDDFREALENGAGAPGRIMLITGQRGFGKTVLLTEFRRIAAQQHWGTIAETASDGLVGRLIDALSPNGTHMDQASLGPSLSIPGIASASLGQVHFSSNAAPLTLRNALLKRLDSRKIGKGKGIVITIDETQAASHDDLIAIATAVQHVITGIDETDAPDEEKKGVAIVFAGLPQMVNDLVNNEVTTFLRRALRRELDNVLVPDVRNAFLETVADSGKTMDEELALRAAKATDGYPYMVQLIGYYMWQSAQRRRSAAISESDVRQGEQDAMMAFDEAVCAPALDGISPAERLFLDAMAQDAPGPARVGDIMDRTRRSRSWVNKYRAVLIRNRMIHAAGHGLVDFSVPHLGTYLRERGAGQAGAGASAA